MTTRVACAQIPCPIGDTAGNRTTCRAAIEAAARDGAQIVVLPELASSGYVFADRDELASLAETRDGAAITEWANLAEAFGLTIVGGFPEAAGDAIYNSAAVVDPTGLRAVYRKATCGTPRTRVFDRGDDLPLRGGHRTRPHRRDDLLRRRVPGMGSRGCAFRRRPALRAGELAAAAAAGGRAPDRDGAGVGRGRV